MTGELTKAGADQGVWRDAVRDVRPLRRATSATGPAARSPEVPGVSALPEKRRPMAPMPPLDRFAGIDRANAERLKRGLYRIEARLDLHGMTQAEAHRALSGFVTASRDAERRCVLVITGRGLGQNGPGILKSSVPRWLEEPELRRHILAIAAAQPQHGGPGAAYLLLRRRR